MKLLILLSRQVSFTKSKMADDHHIGKNKNFYNFATIWDTFTKIAAQIGLDSTGSKFALYFIAILIFPIWWSSAMLDFLKLTCRDKSIKSFISIKRPIFVELSRIAAELWWFFNFQHGGWRPSWILLTFILYEFFYVVHSICQHIVSKCATVTTYLVSTHPSNLPSYQHKSLG